MAAKIEAGSKLHFYQLEDDVAKDPNFDRVERLVEEVFHSIIHKMKVLGLSETQAREIVFSQKSHVEEQKGYQVTTLFSLPGFKDLDQELSAHLRDLINEHPGNSIFFLFYVLYARILNQIEIMDEKEIEGASFHRDSEEMIIAIWLFFVYSEVKFDVDRLVRRTPARTMEYIRILKDPIYFMSEEELHKRIKKYLESYQEKIVSHQLLLHLDLRLLLSLTSHPESLKTIKKFPLIQFDECQNMIHSIADLEPYFDFSAKLLSFLFTKKQQALAKKAGFTLARLIVLPEAALHYSESFRELSSVTKRLHAASAKDFSHTQSLIQKIYKIFVRTTGLVGSETAYSASHIDHILSSSKMNYDILQHWMPVSHSCMLFDLFLHNILNVLNNHHDVDYSGVFRRSQLMCISLGLSHFYDPASELKPCLEPFKKTLVRASDIQFLRLSQEDRKGYTGNLFLGRYDIVNLDLLEKQFNGEVLPADHAEGNNFDPTGMKSVRDDQLPTKYWVLTDFYRFFDRDKFVQSLRDLKKELLKKVSSLPQELVTKELQTSLQVSLANIFKKQIIECIFYRDLKKLLSEKKSKQEVFPDELLDLIFIDLPGVPQQEFPCSEDDEDFTALQMMSSCLLGEAVSSYEEEPPAAAVSSATMAEMAASSVEVADAPSASAAALPKKKKEPAPQTPQTVELEWNDFKNAKKFRQVCELLKMMNYNILRQSGSHVIFGRAEDGEVVVPRHGGDLGTGLLNSIYKQVKGSSDS